MLPPDVALVLDARFARADRGDHHGLDGCDRRLWVGSRGDEGRFFVRSVIAASSAWSSRVGAMNRAVGSMYL
jgi:hypothetical protein